MRDGLGDFNFRKRLWLHAGELFHADEFQQRQKGADNLRAVGGLLEQRGESHRAVFGDEVADVFNLLADRPLVLVNFARAGFLGREAFEDAVDGIEQIKNAHFGFRRRGFGLKFNLPGHARKNIFLPFLQHLQLRGGVLEFFVFHELANQLEARILAFVLGLDDDLLLHGQQLAALDIHERGGHHEKFASYFEVELPHQIHILDELRGELGQVDFIDVHLLLFDKIKEQVERAFKDLELDVVFSHETEAERRLSRAGWQWRNNSLGDYSVGAC